jgi:tryptophanyl-tRNA synthetase
VPRNFARRKVKTNDKAQMTDASDGDLNVESWTLSVKRCKPMRILSGIQPSGVLHIGNYFGMMLPAIALQDEGEALYFIADYHALTSVRDPDVVRENVRRAAVDFLAAGLDPERASLFKQSDVPQVTELTWILSTVAPMGLLERAHSYKDKLARGLAPTVGLFSYPVLMAADILIYDSDIVPVGKDQKQHIEMTRDLAGKMNEQFGQIFKLPEPRINLETQVVPGLDGQKMSKSYGNNIDIFGDEKETRKRVMSIVTDSTPVEAPKDPAKSTIFQLYSLFASKDEIASMRERFETGGTGYGDFKKELFEKLWEYFSPMRKRREEILADKSYIDNVFLRGAKRANEVADDVMTRVRAAVGLR